MAHPIPGYTRTAEDEKYLLALGEFINQFAKNEAMLHHLLRKFAGVESAIGAAVFSGVRVEATMSLIKRTFDVNDPGKPIREEIDQLFTRLRQINDLRNDIVHYGSRDYGDVRIVTNRLMAHTEKRVRERLISPEILRSATYDLNKINIHISFRVLRHTPESLEEPFASILKDPWRHKPLPQGPNRRKNRDATPKQ